MTTRAIKAIKIISVIGLISILYTLQKTYRTRSGTIPTEWRSCTDAAQCVGVTTAEGCYLINSKYESNLKEWSKNNKGTNLFCGMGTHKGPFCINNICQMGAFRCLVKETLITTPSDQTKIEELKVGDKVISRAENRSFSISSVTKILQSETLSFLRIHLDDGTLLEATDVHPIATEAGWKLAGELMVGESIQGISKSYYIEAIERIHEKRSVYDISVEPDKNFFANGILVHNKSL